MQPLLWSNMCRLALTHQDINTDNTVYMCKYDQITSITAEESVIQRNEELDDVQGVAKMSPGKNCNFWETA